MASARSNSNVTFFEHHLAIDLVIDKVEGVKHCLGVDILDQRRKAMTRFVAPVTLLATGGAGQVGSHTYHLNLPHIFSNAPPPISFLLHCIFWSPWLAF